MFCQLRTGIRWSWSVNWSQTIPSTYPHRTWVSCRGLSRSSFIWRNCISTETRYRNYRRRLATWSTCKRSLAGSLLISTIEYASLSQLWIQENNIDYLPVEMKGCKALQHLDIRHNHLGDDSLAVLTCFHNLTILLITHNKFTRLVGIGRLKVREMDLYSYHASWTHICEDGLNLTRSRVRKNEMELAALTQQATKCNYQRMRHVMNAEPITQIGHARWNHYHLNMNHRAANILCILVLHITITP